MGTVTDLLTEISTEGGFEITTSTALTVLDRRHKQMCARARWHRMTRVLTAVTADGAYYSTLEPSTDLVETFSISAPLEGETITYTRTLAADRSAMAAGTLRTSHGGGVFFEGSSETDPTDAFPDTSLWLYPALPDQTVVSLTGTFIPPTITEAETLGAFLRIPEDFHEALLAGVYASLLMRPGESRPDLAATQEQLFSAGCAELRDRADRRYRTRGPRQIRVGGKDI